MKRFKGFTNDQTHQLLKEFGYTGPAQKDDMDAFLASSPRAASQLGRYADIARQRVEGGPLSGIGMQAGGSTTPEGYTGVSRIGDPTEIGLPEQPDMDYVTTPAPTDPLTEEPEPVNFLESLSPKIQEAMREAKTTFNPDTLSTATQDLITTSKAKSKEASDISGRLTKEFYDTQMYSGTHPSGRRPMTPEVGEELKAFVQNNPEFKAAKEAADKAARDAGIAVEGDSAYQTFVQSTQAPEGSQVLKPGTPTPEDSEAGIKLDTAQTAYSEAMGQLTDAQKALSNAASDIPQGASLSDETNRLTFENLDGFKDELGDRFGLPYEHNGKVGNVDYLADDSVFNEAVKSGNIPENTMPGGSAEEGAGEITGEPNAWFIEYPNGLKIGPIAGEQNNLANGIKNDLNTAWTNIKESNLGTSTSAYNTLLKNVEDAELLTTQTQADVSTAQKQFETTDIPSVSEALGAAISNPSKLLDQPTVYGLKVEDGQLIDEGTGQVATAATLLVKQAQDAGKADDPAVKATLAYLNKFSDEELQEKYPLPTPISPIVAAGERAMATTFSREAYDQHEEYLAKLEQRQAQIEQDAKKDSAETYEAVMSQEKVKTALEDFAAAVGVPSDEALMKAEEMTPEDLAQLQGRFKDPATLDTIRQIPEVKRTLQEGETPTAALFDEYTKSEAEKFEGDVEDVDPAKFETETPKATAEVDYSLPPTKIAEQETSRVEDAAKFDEIASAEEKKSEFVADIEAEETAVGADEIVDTNKILNSEEVIVAAKTLQELNDASTAKAATATFTQQLEAKAVKGEVSAASTVQFQLENLMNQFNDGTPAWAAGALRKVNAVMAARGLGASSMASAAMIQATMESAIPIAQSDAATFQAMDMENLRNAQAVALANAAAAQNFELANLSNEQAVRIQNSMNNANLQLKNLSNEQEAVLATAQFKASLQGQELDISANVAIANAARYAAVNDINLSNRQQTSILRSTQNLEVEMANLSNSQQTALSNLQVKAAMMGQELTNEQQMAVLESTQLFEANMADATRKQQAFIQDAVAKAAMEGRVLDNKQQTALFNVANQVAEREIELNNEQQTAIFNMSNKLTIGIEEMSNRQQTALANAQIEAAMKGQELSNKQQVAVIKAERIAEIANMNFTEEQTRALRQSEMALSVDLANLSNEQAKLMADCAALTDVDMANLNNRQQAAAQNAQAFLQMDMANLDNEQQAVMFEAQSLVQSVFSDQAAENAQLQFNAESINQVNQFFDSLSTQVSQFNIAQANAMEQFNAGEENSMTKFQAELDNQRDMFNAQNELVIAQANTAWRQAIATANTAALNEANMAEVMAANNMTMQGLAELWQQERDLMNYAWTTAENQVTRDHELVLAKIDADADEDSAFSSAAGDFLSAVVGAVFRSK
jgi:hypothetical protein